MPQRPDAKASLSRSRTNRITHKTRLKVLVGNFDVDNIIDDGEQIDYHTHGVEAHESTEVHLQRTLSAATLVHQTKPEPQVSRKAQQHAPPPPPPEAIPIPDASGVVDDSQLYPHNRFQPNALYIKYSDTVEETIDAALAGAYTYYLDERDKAWLDKNNQAARGEGSSAQAARNAAASSSQHKRNGKAKELEVSSAKAVEMSEDDFELVMGLFERRAADPPFFFSESSFPDMEIYEDWFRTPLSGDLFTAYRVPKGIPDSERLLEMARCVYPHWKQRRLLQGNHLIIPQLCADETIANDSYTCFRRRELRPMRRTRRQTDSSATSDPLLQLRKEMLACLDVTTLIVKREIQKRQIGHEIRELANARIDFAQMKRQHPTLGERTDEQLLFDKEPRVRKKRPVISLSVNTSAHKRLDTSRVKNEATDRATPTTALESCNIAQQRSEEVLQSIEKELARQKQEDSGYEDNFDFPNQKMWTPAANRLFKASTGPGRLLGPVGRSSARLAHRVRTGRGGRVIMDRTRRESSVVSTSSTATASSLATLPSGTTSGAASDDALSPRRWQFDLDNVDPDPEATRRFVDDFQPAILRTRSTLLHPSDLSYLLTVTDGSRSHDYRFGSGNSPTVLIPGNRGMTVRRRGSIVRPPGLPGSRHTLPSTPTSQLGPSSAVTPSSFIPPTAPATRSHAAMLSTPVPPLPPLQPSPLQQIVKTEANLSAVSSDMPNSAAATLHPIRPATGAPASGSSVVPVGPVVPTSTLSVAPNAAPRQPAVKTEPATNGAIPAKARLRLADNDAVQIKGRAKSKPAEDASSNGKLSGKGSSTVPAIGTRVNGSTGHNGSTAVNGNGNGKMKKGGAQHESRSQSIASSQGGASESASTSG